MLHRFSLRFCVLTALLALAFGSIAAGAQRDRWGRGRKYKPPPPTSHIVVTVLRNDNGKPIANAAVIFHPIVKGKDKGGLEMKSDENGKAVLDIIPIGDTIRLQIIANGYQTYGREYKVDKPEMAMRVRLKLPQPEYSIYKKHNATTDSGDGAGAEQKNAPKDESANPSNDKPSSSVEQGSQRGSGESQAQQK